ncbi:Arginase/deacetylase [Fomitiporia mediterranea MF3/22]|uniref:Arginase/deacetylase n=1 Tax=Fomitiporia mediterranea (strain MF3/22) TaxID=694068 RepID=UPI0004408B20|nr:Arginase/deacetylase [Fomitiporia mediterranea MF3/22]EJD01127.1 Arginase/deacetylase [Fomitiporia mediterranea MF3/22]
MDRKSRVAIFLQDACYKHQFIRSNDVSRIVERPERLRALKLGFAAAIARIEEVATGTNKGPINEHKDAVVRSTEDELVAALEKLDMQHDVNVVDIISSSSSVDILNNKAVKFVHGDIEGDVYLENLIKWAKESTDKVQLGESEIPSHLSQGDLYRAYLTSLTCNFPYYLLQLVCPGSLDAIQGALGTVCEAVDAILGMPQHDGESLKAAPTNAFVAIRPPGHHCGEDSPSGFCFMNNVVVAAAHAHLTHGVKKVIIFDIDLHHGNGTQELAWQINEETYRQTLETESAASETSSGLQIFYGSLHDVLSFPCEDGNKSIIQAASVSIHGLHGQHIENIHLQEYQSEEDFWKNLYPQQYSKLIKKAEDFVKDTNKEDVLVFISCGFDACEHEYPSMSRHNRRVPTSFYFRFAVDANNFANRFANGKLISVLEGGYSDRALISGGMAHISGLVDAVSLGAEINEEWWSVPNLTLLEKVLKKRRGKASVGGDGEKWLERTNAIFDSIETVMTPSPSKAQTHVPPSSRTLRERKPASSNASPIGSPQAQRRTKAKVTLAGKVPGGAMTPRSESVDDVTKRLEGLELEKTNVPVEGTMSDTVKKVPRVILRVKDPNES